VTLRAEEDNEETVAADAQAAQPAAAGRHGVAGEIDLSSGQPRRRYSFKLLWNNRQLWFTPQV
jgi:alpha-glucosidase